MKRRILKKSPKYKVLQDIFTIESSGCYWDATDKESGYGPLTGEDALSAAVTCHVNHNGKLIYKNGILYFKTRTLIARSLT